MSKSPSAALGELLKGFFMSNQAVDQAFIASVAMNFDSYCLRV